MIWIMIILLSLTWPLKASKVEIAGNWYLVTSAFGEDILDSAYRQSVVNQLKKGYYGVILTDYEPHLHLERLKKLDLFNDFTQAELELMGEKVLISYIRNLTSNGFDVGLLGRAGLDYTIRGVTFFTYFEQAIYYSESLFYKLPLLYLPHQDWQLTFDKEKEQLLELSASEATPFYQLSLLCLRSLSPDKSLEAIEDFRSSLKKAGLEGSRLDYGWSRLLEIALQVERQKRQNRHTEI